MKKTNFLQGLYSDEELTPAYLKEGRDNKTLFMKKLVTAVCKFIYRMNIIGEKRRVYLDIAVKRPPDVRVSKILAGQEADKTNLLLQALAEAITLDVDNNDVVRKTLQNVGDTNENEEPAPPPTRSRDQKDQERSERHRSKEERSSKSHEREEPAPERKSSSRDASKVKILKN